MKRLVEQQHRLTPKGQILGKYILENPRKAVFMSNKELAETCEVSEATVVRFFGHLDYDGYGAFQRALRDYSDSRLAWPAPGRFRQAITAIRPSFYTTFLAISAICSSLQIMRPAIFLIIK